MNADSKTARSIFLSAIEKADPGARSTYLREACGNDRKLRDHVQCLIDAHEEIGEFMAHPAPGQVSTAIDADAKALGTQIGPYKLLEVIGEGGMGTVYMAQQTEPVNRRVALKLIKNGMDTKQVIARFEAERQALAMMDHPNIAKVLDAGSTDSGRPYFVMELVKGKSITEFSDQQKLDTDARLQLFQQVCLAVQHAHQKGIIHRDLKPSNVIVGMYDDKPVPKVIDFGVAKATGEQLTQQTMFTRFGQIVGTLEYMSPEQAQLNNLDIDTRSDIYSLGAILCELLSGEPPFDREKIKKQALDETLRMIREDEPTKPSTKFNGSSTSPMIASNRNSSTKKLGSVLRGELDWIVMKAVEKNRNRRYETANALASDVRSFLDDETVDACPPSSSYLFWKFAHRHKISLSFTTVVLLALVAGFVGLAVSNYQITKRESEKQKALKLATESEKQKNVAYDFILKEIVESAMAGSAGSHDITVRESVLAANKKVDQVFQKDPFIRAHIKSNFGHYLTEIGEYELARKNLESAIETFAELTGIDDLETTHTRRKLIRVYWELDELDLAVATARQVFRESSQDFDKLDRRTINAMWQLGVALSRKKQYAEAEEILKHVVSLSQQEGFPQLEALANNDLGNCHFFQQKYSLAEKHWLLALEQFEILGNNDFNILAANYNLANAYWETGRQQKSIEIGHQVVAALTELQGAQHPQTLTALEKLGGRLFNAGQFSGALKKYRQLLQVLRERFGNNHEKTARIMTDIGSVFHALGQYEEAVSNQKAALEIERKEFGNRHPRTLKTLAQLGLSYHGNQDLEKAESCFRDAIEARSKMEKENSDLDSNAIALGGTYCNLGLVLLDQPKRIEEAHHLFSKAISTLENSGQPTLNAKAKTFLANSYVARSRYFESKKQLKKSLVDAGKAVSLAPTQQQKNTMRLYHARLFAKSGEVANAVQVVESISPNGNSGEVFYLSARVFALCAAHTHRNSTADDQSGRDEFERYSTRVVQLLRKADDEKYFVIESRLNELSTESDFEVVRQSPKFEQFLRQRKNQPKSKTSSARK